MEEYHQSLKVGFRDGWLYVSDEGRMARLHGWPGLEVEERSAGGIWEPRDFVFRDNLYETVWPNSRLWTKPARFQFAKRAWWDSGKRQRCFPWAMETCERAEAWMRHCTERFDATVPAGIWRQLRWGPLMRIPCDWLSSLVLARSAPQLLDLRVNDPLLASALARHWEFPGVGREDWMELHRRAGRRRRELLEWLGYQASEPVVNALRRHRVRNVPKLQVARCVRDFFEVVQDPCYGPELLRLPSTQNELVSSLRSPAVRSWLNAELLRDILRSNKLSTAAAANEIEVLAELVECGLAEPSLAFLRELRRHRGRTSDWVLECFEDLPFPRWPHPMRQTVEPITSVHDLVQEGCEMEHCVGSLAYIAAALRGDLAAFRVTVPVRATLTLYRVNSGWCISELKGARNADVSPEHRRQIERAFCG